MKYFFALVALLLIGPAFGATAQQRIAYVDSEEIMRRTPEYATVQQKIDRLAQQWEAEIEKRESDLEEKFREYQARELLYTEAEAKRKREEIVREEEEIDKLRMKYFGPEGDYFEQQDNLMQPLQERILEAVEEVATTEGYDYVFDRTGDFVFMFARPQYDLTEQVLEEMGIDVGQTSQRN